jgi:hypothetical protein
MCDRKETLSFLCVKEKKRHPFFDNLARLLLR